MQIFRSSNGAKRNLKSQNDMFNFSWTCRFCYIRCEMTPTSAGGEQQNYISGGIQSPI